MSDYVLQNNSLVSRNKAIFAKYVSKQIPINEYPEGLKRMEKDLFVAHFLSKEDLSVPLLKEPFYLVNENLYLPYLSDLMRCTDSMEYFSNLKSNRFVELYQDYVIKAKYMSDFELDEAVQFYLEANKDLVRETDKAPMKYRYRARLTVYQRNTGFKEILRLIFLSFPVVFMFPMILILFIIKVNNPTMLMSSEGFVELLTMYVLLIPLWLGTVLMKFHENSFEKLFTNSKGSS